VNPNRIAFIVFFTRPGLARQVGQGQENHFTLPNNRELSRAKSRVWRGTWPLYRPQVPKSYDYFAHESESRSILLTDGLSILEKAEQRRGQERQGSQGGRRAVSREGHASGETEFSQAKVHSKP
jgi:hypothetical protein